MAEFPANVSTQTSSPSTQGNTSVLGPVSHYVSVDVAFLRTYRGILMLVEIVLGLLVWALISGSLLTFVPAYGWVMFVSVTLWILTVLLFFLLFLRVHTRVSGVPWPLALLAFNAAATLLYLTAFLANAATVAPYRGYLPYNNLAAAAFFGILVTLSYGTSTFFAFLDWRGDGGNAATNTIPA